MQTNDDNNESDPANQRIPGIAASDRNAAQGAADEIMSSSGQEPVEGAERGTWNTGSIWRDGPMRSAEPELVMGGSTQSSIACHDNGDPDSSAYETNYGDEAQDSSSGAPEGSWSIPVQVGPMNPRLPTNE